LRDIAAASGVHPSHLATAFRRAFGCTVGEVKRQRRMARAINLLARDTPLAEIAAACGFADQSHFTREFRRAVGTTPANFRRNQSRTKR
jgi:AraC-like DNA-binding protein